MERLGHVARNPSEDVWVLLQDVQGVPHVELRVYGHPVPGYPAPLPGREGISLPVELLPVLLRVLTQAQEALAERGLLAAPPAPAAAKPWGGAVTLHPAGPPVVPGRRDKRRHARVPVNLTVECSIVDPGRFRPPKPVVGQIMDVSSGGAQAVLSERLPHSQDVDIFMVINGTVFQGRAKIVGTEMEAKGTPKAGPYRHHLQWIVLDANAKAALAKVLPPK